MSYRSRDFNAMYFIGKAMKSASANERKGFFLKAGHVFKAEHLARWKEILRDCEGNIIEAERCALMELTPPAHWKTWVECQHCGPVPVKNGGPLDKPADFVLHCDWCPFMPSREEKTDCLHILEDRPK